MTPRPDLEELEGLFARSALTRRQFVSSLTALGVTASGLELLLGSAPQPAAAQTVKPKYLVVIVLDAFRPDYMNLAPMPALASLSAAGIIYDRAWAGHVESETPTGHAALSTGALPKNDGILGFEWRDPRTKREVLDGWGQGVLSGAFEQDLRAAGTSSIPLAFKAVDPKARVVALSSEKVYAADAMGGWAADYILYHARTKQNLLVPRAVPNHSPPADFFQHPALRQPLPMKHFTDWDYLSTMLALAAFAELRPRVLMVNLPGADVYGHPFGGPATPAVMRDVAAGADRNVGRIVDAYKTAGIYDETLFVVTADHGMVPNDRAVDGKTTRSVVQSAGGEYLFHTGGTAACIYLRNPSSAARVASAMAKVPGVEGAYYQTVSHGKYEYVQARGSRIDPDLDAAYRYLLWTCQGPTAPDVVAPFRENTIGSKVSHAHGDHGGLNWGAQHIPLILAGPGVPVGEVSHFPARLIDIAPTVLQLFGLPSPNMDGIVLADATLSASGDHAARQTRLGPALTAYQDALIAQSASNIAEDLKHHIVPPPSSPLKP